MKSDREIIDDVIVLLFKKKIITAKEVEGLYK